jgi:trimeric autotransporter adhesin
MKKNSMKTKTSLITNSTNRSRLRYGLFVIPLVLAAFALSPTAQAQLSPPPDGGYPNDNTAEGTDALFSLTTGSDNTAIGFDALFGNTTGDSNTATGSIALSSNTTGIRNTADGFAALNSNTTGERNTATGRAALAFNTIGNYNTADGHDALFNNTAGVRNEATGSFALFFNTAGNDNAAVGFFALYNNTTGNNNIGLGNFAGNNLTTGNNNIDIGNQGVAGETGTIRIGVVGTQTATFVAGIMGKTVPMSTPVFVNANGQLGTTPSSERFKDAIKPMDKASEAILALKPVTFHYKKELDPDRTPQFGLVAEEVEKVNPNLVVRDEKGQIYTVRYDAVNAMLLNEFLKEHQKVQKLEAALATINNRLSEQDAKIDKVDARIEVSKPAPQLVSNNQR